MSRPSVFFDTNVVLYLMGSDERKADISEKLISAGGTVSVQVLNECVAVTRGKTALPWKRVHDFLDAVRMTCEVVPLTLAVHERGLPLVEKHGFHVYDAMIVAAAIEAGCSVLYSEDMQHGRKLDGLTIRNPYATV